MPDVLSGCLSLCSLREGGRVPAEHAPRMRRNPSQPALLLLSGGVSRLASHGGRAAGPAPLGGVIAVRHPPPSFRLSFRL